MVAATITAPTCSARTGYTAGKWGEEPVWCNAHVGLTRYTDTHGNERAYCRHHRTFVEHRYPAAVACRFCGRVEPILRGTYQRFVDPREGIFLACDDCVEKADFDDEDES